jgi:tellurite resistance protein
VTKIPKSLVSNKWTQCNKGKLCVVSDSVERGSIEHLPVSIFASTMGLGGLAIATASVEGVFGLPAMASLVLAFLNLALWFALLVAYTIKVVRFPEALLAELDHPIRLSFFPTISIGLILVSISFLGIFEPLAQLFWWLGTLGQFGFTLLVLNRWFHRESFETAHNSPAWFIPIVGNILVPVAGAQLGYLEISYFFFAFGLIFWLPLLAISLNRSFFFGSIPKKLRPTLFILIAPPAVGMLSWSALHGGNPGELGLVLYYSALFFLVMLISQAKWFIPLQFGLPWWAYTFPLAAMSLASFAIYAAIPNLHYLVIALALYAVLAILVLLVGFKTARGLVTGSLLRPE